MTDLIACGCRCDPFTGAALDVCARHKQMAKPQTIECMLDEMRGDLRRLVNYLNQRHYPNTALDVQAAIVQLSNVSEGIYELNEHDVTVGPSYQPSRMVLNQPEGEKP